MAVNLKEQNLVILITLTIAIALLLALIRTFSLFSNRLDKKAAEQENVYPGLPGVPGVPGVQELPQNDDNSGDNYKKIIENSKSQYRDFMEQQKKLIKNPEQN